MCFVGRTAQSSDVDINITPVLLKLSTGDVIDWNTGISVLGSIDIGAP